MTQLRITDHMSDTVHLYRESRRERDIYECIQG